MDDAVRGELEEVPAELKELKQWVTWHYIDRDGTGELSKFPSQGGGLGASSRDPKTWTTFENAIYFWRLVDRVEGVGFMFSADDPYCGVDLDGCRNPDDGTLAAWASEILDRFDTYCEVSPSGTGVKLICRARSPFERGRNRKLDSVERVSDKTPGLEIYDHRRFWTFTGRRLPRKPGEVRDCQEAIAWLCERYKDALADPVEDHSKGNGSTFVGAAPAPGDAVVLEKAYASSNGDKIRSLFGGSHDGYPSASEADMALASMMAFWVGPDVSRLVSLMNQSGLVRAKWGKVHGDETYIQMTCRKAVQSTSQFFPWMEDRFKDTRFNFRGTKPQPNADDDEQEPAANEAVDDPHRLARVNLERYATRFDGATIRNWRDEWYVWKKNRYRRIPTGELEAKICLSVKDEFNRLNIEEQREARKRIPEARKVTQATTRNVMAATKSMVIIPAHVELGTWIDDIMGVREPRQLVSLENGLLDMAALMAGGDDVLLPHTPRWFSTVTLPYKFDIDAKCPTWLEVLGHNLEGDHERLRLLQEWAGYMLLPDTGQQSFLVLEGEGANGKSVYMAGLEAMLGEDNCSHVPLELFGDRFSRTQTLGKLANIAPDVGELDKPAEGHLKSFTSGEKMFFDRKNLAGLEAYPTARLMIGCNNRPRFADKSDGVFRRMIPVPFRVKIAQARRVANMDKPWWWSASGELPGMLLWAVAGLDRLRQRGYFKLPAICLEALDDYRVENNPTMQFLRENTSVQEGAETLCNDVYDRYRRWCVNNGFHPLSSRSFGKEVFRFASSKGRVRRQQRRTLGKPAWFYVGLNSEQSDNENSQTEEKDLF